MTQHTDPSASARRDASVERYILALDAADFETVTSILAAAQTDPELDRLLIEVDSALHAEAMLPTRQEDAQKVRQILRRHLHSAFLEPETGPPTVGDVAAKLQAEHASGQQPLLPGDLQANGALLQQPAILAGRLTPRAIRQLVGPLGVAASDRYWELFRRAAVELALIREGREPHQAAARPRTPPRRGTGAPGQGEEQR